jgi:hypothetical protein
MTLADYSTGSDLVGWIVLLVLLALSLVLLSGHGAFLIAGYNTASKETRDKYNAKKLCRVTGGGLFVLVLLIGAMLLWQSILPVSSLWVFGVLIVLDVVGMIVLLNTICKK